ncbi:MAG TPA: universal stress protein [Candidatus Dormibacteraeota bacterium]|nr:universal stress protein [Candidatus Dormibacteraeota bacterium]
MPKIRRILVPIDFSPASLKALDYAADLAKPLDAELCTLFVVEPIYYAVPDLAGAAAGTTVGLLEEQRKSGRQQLERLQARYAKRRITLRTLLQTGTPYQAIVDSAKSLKANLIVMSTHGRTGMTHLLLGSVAERVVRTSACPVLTIRTK